MTGLRIACAAIVAPALLWGCDQRMGDEGRIKPQEGLPGRVPSARYLPAGAVPRGGERRDTPRWTGRERGGGFAAFPFPVSEGLVREGGEGYRVFCAVCHGARGGGDGPVVRRGFTRPRPLDPYRPPGYYVDAMVRGFRDMDTFADVLGADERWAVAAYITRGLKDGKGAPR